MEDGKNPITRIALGVYHDARDSSVHIDTSEIIQHFDLTNTPENHNMVAEIATAMLQERVGKPLVQINTPEPYPDTPEKVRARQADEEKNREGFSNERY